MYLLLVAGGWLSIYGAGYEPEQSSFLTFDSRAGKQLLWIFTAMVMAVAILLVDWKVYGSFFSYLLYIGTVLLLLLVIVGGMLDLPFVPDIKGSRSWLVLGPVNVQPAELAKVATALALARYVSLHKQDFPGRALFVAGMLVAIPFFLIILQKETGSALVFVAFLLVFYREGMSGLVLLVGVAAVLLFVIIVYFGNMPVEGSSVDWGMVVALSFILLSGLLYVLCIRRIRREALVCLGAVCATGLVVFLLHFLTEIKINYVAVLIAVAAVFCLYWSVVFYMKQVRGLLVVVFMTIGAVLFCLAADYLFNSVLKPHQQMRIKVTLNMEDDPRGAGYNAAQSEIAIGSGGLTGKGFLKGTQSKMKYLPEQDTDFIFCIVGEEFGFVGAAGLLCLYVAFLLRLVYIAERQHDAFNRIYAYGVVSIFFFHLVVNIGMVIGLLPIIGIPLPFFSYGGSSLWAFTIMIFILLRLDASRADRLS